MAFAMRNEEKFYYEQLGDVSSPYTLVFIHGATMTGGGLRPFAETLAKYNCIVLDLPGHGQCVGETQHSVEDFADRVQYTIEKLVEEHVASEHVILVGYSMGGSITLELGYRKAKYVKRLVILSSGSDFKGNVPLIDPLVEIDFKDFDVNAVFENLFGQNTTGAKREAIKNLYVDTKVDDRICFDDLRAVQKYDKLCILKEIELPALAVIGDEDVVVPAQRALNIRENLKGSALCVVPYCGHAVLYEEKEIVSKAIEDFIIHTNK